MENKIVTLEQAGKHLMEEGVVNFENMTVEGKQLLEVCGYPVDDKVSQHIKRQISKHSFEEGKDFNKRIDTASKSQRKPMVYEFTIEASSIVYANRKNTAITRFEERKEQRFKLLLQSAFPDINIITQYLIKMKRIDFYLPEYNIAIEYDELHHISQANEDLERQTMIEDVLGCQFIRVPEGSEGAAIIEVYDNITEQKNPQ